MAAGEQDDDWGLSGALAKAKKEKDDPDSISVVSNSGLSADAAAEGPKELPYVTLLNAAVSMVKTGQLSMDEYVAGVKKLDVIADNALKVYAIPAVKNDLPGKLNEHQNSLVSGLEAEIHRMKEGLGLLLRYPQTMASSDIEEGHKMAVAAMNAMAVIQKEADAERARHKERLKEDKARRAQQAAEAE
jgi:hypothetical protein